MLNKLLEEIPTIYLVYGPTDFRKQIHSLMNMVKTEYNMNPYQKAAFLFCNRKRNSIKLLCYDKNGFILAQKTLLDVSKYKFRWPKDEKELGQITHEQLRWLLSGLQVCPKSYFKDIEIENDKMAI